MKCIKSKIVLFVTAVLLAITAMGSLVTAYATEKQEIDSQGSMVYSEQVVADATSSDYNLIIKMTANVEFASFEFALQFPSFVKVISVSETDELAKLTNASFEYQVQGDGNLVYVSFTSSQNVMGDVDLINVNFQIFDVGYGAPYFYDSIMFTNTRFQYFTSVGCAFGDINAGGEIPIPTVNKGDVNLDGSVTLADLVMMQRHIVNRGSEYLSGEAFNNGDIDCDGNVNTIDCQYVQMYLVGELGSLNGIGSGSGNNGEIEDDKKYFNINVFVVDKEGNKLAEFDTKMYDREYIFEHLYNKTYLGQFEIQGAYYDEAQKIPVGDVETIKGPTRLYVVVKDFVPQETATLKVYLMLRNEYGTTEQYDYLEIEVAMGSEVGPAVEYLWNSQPYLYQMMSGDMYGNVELPYGRIVKGDTEVYLIYANKNGSGEIMKTFDVTVVICGADGNEIHRVETGAYQGQYIYELLQNNVELYKYSFEAYYDMNFNGQIDKEDVFKESATIYVVCPDYKVIQKVKVNVTLVSLEEGEIRQHFNSTVEIEETATVWDACMRAGGVGGYRTVKMTYDAYGNQT